MENYFYMYPVLFVHENALYEAPSIYDLMEVIPTRLKELAQTDVFGKDARLIMYSMLIHMLPVDLPLTRDLDDFLVEADGEGLQRLLQAWQQASESYSMEEAEDGS